MPNSNTKILIIEDDEDVANFLSQFLLREGYTVLAANDGESGLFMLAEQDDISLIILDWMMPGMNGIDVLAELAEQPAAPPVLMLSAKGDREDIMTAIDAGATDYIQKPVQRDRLVHKVQTILREDAERLRMTAARRMPVNFHALAPFVVREITSEGCVLESTFKLQPKSVLFLRSDDLVKALDQPWEFRFSLRVRECEGDGTKFRIVADHLNLSPPLVTKINKLNETGGWLK